MSSTAQTMKPTGEKHAGKPREESFVSLPVNNVQALAATFTDSSPENEIPSRYIRLEDMAEKVVTDAGEDIPIIDFSRLLDPCYTQEESSRLESTCDEWGFFQLINHGAPSDVIDKMKSDTKEFFKLPLSEKQAFGQQPGSVEGYGQLFVMSDDQKLDWADMVYFFAQPTSARNTHIWPTKPSTFASTLDRYSNEVYDISKRLLGFMFKNLGVRNDEKVGFLKDWRQTVRINYYPPCPQGDKVVGLSPHSDMGMITLLLQVNGVQGLQIKINGNWVPVKPLPDAFVVNIGDALEIYSNGRYRSIEHRAVVNAERERISMAAFLNPSADAVIEPLSEVVQGGQARYAAIDYKSFRKLFFSAKLDGKSSLDCLKLAVDDGSPCLSKQVVEGL